VRPRLGPVGCLGRETDLNRILRKGLAGGKGEPEQVAEQKRRGGLAWRVLFPLRQASGTLHIVGGGAICSPRWKRRFAMTDPSIERKKQLIWDLAEELGIKIRELKETGRRGQGFRGPQFEALAAAAEKFADIMAGTTSMERSQAAEDLVEHYWKHDTDRTEKSEGGGSRSGMKVMVRCGYGARLIHEGLQTRVDHWQTVKNTSPPGERPAEAAERMALAERYTSIRNQTPPKKHAGRPGKVIGPIEIKQTAGGTNSNSITWEVGRLFLDHGDAVLADDMLDAILDNGGALTTSVLPSFALQDILARVQTAIDSVATPSHEVKLLRKALAALDPGSPT